MRQGERREERALSRRLRRSLSSSGSPNYTRMALEQMLKLWLGRHLVTPFPSAHTHTHTLRKELPGHKHMCAEVQVKQAALAKCPSIVCAEEQQEASDMLFHSPLQNETLLGTPKRPVGALSPE